MTRFRVYADPIRLPDIDPTIVARVDSFDTLPRESLMRSRRSVVVAAAIAVLAALCAVMPHELVHAQDRPAAAARADATQRFVADRVAGGAAWYGIYVHGTKSGHACVTVTRDGTTADATFREDTDVSVSLASLGQEATL